MTAARRQRKRRSRDLSIEEVAEAYGLDPVGTGIPTRKLRYYVRAVRDLAFGHFLIAAYRCRAFLPQRQVEFVGGTALRKTRFGADSRMSVDLDFGVPEGVERVFWESMHGMKSGPFAFFPYVTDARNGRLLIESSLFPNGQDVVHLDLSQKPRLMLPEMRRMMPMPCDDTYSQPAGDWLPVMPVLENAAGKLGRWYQRMLIRDLYDLRRLAPQLAPEISELARIVVCMAAHRPRPQQLISTPYGEEPAFVGLGHRLHDVFSEDEALLIYEDLHFLPDISKAEKTAQAAESMEIVLGLTDALEAEIIDDDRLLRIAQSAPDAAGLARDLDDELRSAYGTADPIYRFGQRHAGGRP